MRKEIKKSTWVYGILTILWVMVIFSFSLQTGEESGGMSLALLVRGLGLLFPKLVETMNVDLWHLLLRKCAHFAEYFILGVLSWGTVKELKWGEKRFWIIGFCVSIAILDETLQCFISGRVGSVWDTLLDSTGALAGILILYFISRPKREV